MARSSKLSRNIERFQADRERSARSEILFDRMIQAFVMLTMPQIQHHENELSLIATGLNGYVTQIAIRWVMGGFEQSLEQVLTACRIVFLSLLAQVSK